MTPHARNAIFRRGTRTFTVARLAERDPTESRSSALATQRQHRKAIKAARAIIERSRHGELLYAVPEGRIQRGLLCMYLDAMT